MVPLDYWSYILTVLIYSKLICFQSKFSVSRFQVQCFQVPGNTEPLHYRNLTIKRYNMQMCLCPGLQFTMDEEREVGGPTSKTTLTGEHGRQSKAKR